MTKCMLVSAILKVYQTVEAQHYHLMVTSYTKVTTKMENIMDAEELSLINQFVKETLKITFNMDIIK